MLSSEEDSSRGSAEPSDSDGVSRSSDHRRSSDSSTVVRQPKAAAIEGSQGPAAIISRTMKIRVQVDDEVLLIPCPAGEARTISWLIEEAGIRYRANMGAKVCDHC